MGAGAQPYRYLFCRCCAILVKSLPSPRPLFLCIK